MSVKAEIPSRSVIRSVLGFFAVGSVALVAASQLSSARTSQSSSRRALSPKSLPGMVWTRKLSGFVSELGVSRDGGAIFFATLPDLEREDGTGQKDHRVGRIGREGRVLWTRKTEGQVKSLALSSDGRLGVWSDYQDRLTAVDSGGRVLWKVHGACKPIILTPLSRVICYHDDDAEPKVAWELLDARTGHRITEMKIDTDVLGLKASRDGRSFAVALTGKEGKGARVHVFSGEAAKAGLSFEVTDPVVDLAISSGARPSVAVLASAADRTRRVMLHDGTRIREVMTPVFSEQIEINEEGSRLVTYSNGTRGQRVTAYVPQGDQTLAEVWSQGVARPSEYSAGVVLGASEFLVGYERGPKNETRVAAYTMEGRLSWELPVTLEEGSYLQSQVFAPVSQRLIVATDDARISLWDPSKAPTRQ